MKKLFALVLGLLIATTGHAEIKFLHGQLAEATKKADTEKKPVMIDFITDWCRWCDTLDARTYSDADVAGYVNEHLVAIKIDAEKGEGISIAKKYGVAAYPTIVFIRPNGEEIDRILGYVQAEPFLKTVTDYVNGVNTLSALLEQLQSKPNDGALHYALATKYADRNNSNSASEHFKKLIEFDPANSLGHNEEAEYNVAVATFNESKDPRPVEAFTAKYPKSEMVRSALYTLWRSYTKAKDGVNARKYFTQYIEKNPNDAGMMNTYAWGCAENGINLDHAAEAAKTAVDLATKDADRASFLDTYATVEFARGNTEKAIALEQQALDILKTIPNAKLVEYERSMAKFKSGKKSAGTQ
jgi:thioredoxin-related protein/Flp pilus assembly protein TadD